MTKKAAKAHKAKWNKALAEHRIVSFNHGETMREYLTVEEATTAVIDALKAGIPAKDCVVWDRWAQAYEASTELPSGKVVHGLYNTPTDGMRACRMANHGY
jgi:hypothetical protein